MKQTVLKIMAAVMLSFAALCFAGCKEEEPQENAISQETAMELMENYLTSKGFDEDDFLAEGNIMVLDGEKVYAFSWRTKVDENADRLFGMYAVSFDGRHYYEYQSARDEWIRDMNAD